MVSFYDTHQHHSETDCTIQSLSEYLLAAMTAETVEGCQSLTADDLGYTAV